MRSERREKCDEQLGPEVFCAVRCQMPERLGRRLFVGLGFVRAVLVVQAHGWVSVDLGSSCGSRPHETKTAAEMIHGGFGLSFLNNAGLLEGLVCAVFGNGLDALGGEGKSNIAVEFRHKNTLLLEVGIFADHPSRVELGCAHAVRVAAGYKRALFSYGANPGHIFNRAMVP